MQANEIAAFIREYQFMACPLQDLVLLVYPKFIFIKRTSALRPAMVRTNVGMDILLETAKKRVEFI